MGPLENQLWVKSNPEWLSSSPCCFLTGSSRSQLIRKYWITRSNFDPNLSLWIWVSHVPSLILSLTYLIIALTDYCRALIPMMLKMVVLLYLVTTNNWCEWKIQDEEKKRIVVVAKLVCNCSCVFHCTKSNIWNIKLV